MSTMSPIQMECEQQDGLKREQFLKDVLITAIEGGVGYWSEAGNYDPENGTVTLWTEGEDDPAEMTTRNDVTTATIERGVRAICENSELVNRTVREDTIIDSVENVMVRGDAETADCIVQIGLFGKLVYG